MNHQRPERQQATGRLPSLAGIHLKTLGGSLALLSASLSPALAAAAETESGRGFGAERGATEFSIAGTGSSDRNVDAGSFGLSGDLGWYLTDRYVIGIRQSLAYASVKGDRLKDDFWNGATRGYMDYHFSDSSFRPFLGASLGGLYGDGISDSGFAGVEIGLKYFVKSQTFVLARAEYQWFFRHSNEADNNFDDGAWAYTVGIGFLL